jgi:hypothetical protein
VCTIPVRQVIKNEYFTKIEERKKEGDPPTEDVPEVKHACAHAFAHLAAGLPMGSKDRLPEDRRRRIRRALQTQSVQTVHFVAPGRTYSLVK